MLCQITRAILFWMVCPSFGGVLHFTGHAAHIVTTALSKKSKCIFFMSITTVCNATLKCEYTKYLNWRVFYRFIFKCYVFCTGALNANICKRCIKSAIERQPVNGVCFVAPLHIYRSHMHNEFVLRKLSYCRTNVKSKHSHFGEHMRCIGYWVYAAYENIGEHEPNTHYYTTQTAVFSYHTREQYYLLLYIYTCALANIVSIIKWFYQTNIIYLIFAMQHKCICKHCQLILLCACVLTVWVLCTQY